MYEKHVTMFINGLFACAFGIVVLYLIESCMFMMAFSAASTAPTSVYPLLWNMWVGTMIFVLAKEAMGLLRSIFFAETHKEKLLEPNFKAVISMPDNTQIGIYNNNDNVMGHAAILLAALNKSENGPATPKTTHKCPDTPDSERSKAETEIKTEQGACFYFHSLRATNRALPGPLRKAIGVEAMGPDASSSFGPGLTFGVCFQTDGAH